MADVKSGTRAEAYPASNDDLDTPVSNGVKNPSRFEYKLNGPEDVPAVVNVINTVIILVLSWTKSYYTYYRST